MRYKKIHSPEARDYQFHAYIYKSTLVNLHSSNPVFFWFFFPLFLSPNTFFLLAPLSLSFLFSVHVHSLYPFTFLYSSGLSSFSQYVVFHPTLTFSYSISLSLSPLYSLLSFSYTPLFSCLIVCRQQSLPLLRIFTYTNIPMLKQADMRILEFNVIQINLDFHGLYLP